LYPNDKQGKIRLYNKIFNIEEVEETAIIEGDAVELFKETKKKELSINE